MIRRTCVLAAALFALSGTASAAWDGPLVPASHAAAPACGGCEAPAPAPCASCETKGSVCEKCKGGLLKGLGLKVSTGSGCRMPVGCGSLAAERNFMLGGCNKFFGCGKDCGGRGGLFGGACAISAQGCGGLGDHTPCVYGSYINR